MKKKIITLIIVIILLGLTILTYFFNSRDNNTDNDLTHVTIAEPILT